MKNLRRKWKKEEETSDNLLSKGEVNFLFIMVILLVMATIVDLNISFDQVFGQIFN